MSVANVRNGRRPGPGERPDRYGMMFVLLLASFIVAGVLDGRLARLVTLLLYVVALILALRFARLPASTARLLRHLLVAGSALVAVLVIAVHGPVIEGIAAIWTAAFLLLTVFVVVGRVLRHRVVTMQTIFGALSAYLLVGFFFVALFTAAARLAPGPFFAGGEPADGDAIQYFAFITLTTTGYGDLTPASAPGRSLAVLDALCGQIFLVTLVARLVSVFGTERRRPSDDVAPADG
ncbi:potassium channel family protein [Actinoplanes sp. NPDC049668]|uniref:potassium channel family protein n=1 Tax=unclassified Actinoplanes TaxID=2626549 RepID=UPI0033BC3169